MECLHEDTDGVRIIRLAGRMDIDGNGRVSQQFNTLTAFGTSSVVVDLSEVEFLSSLGISTLVTGAKNVRLRKGVLALCGARPNVQSALERTNITAIIPTCATLDEARALVASPAAPCPAGARRRVAGASDESRPPNHEPRLRAAAPVEMGGRDRPAARL